MIEASNRFGVRDANESGAATTRAAMVLQAWPLFESAACLRATPLPEGGYWLGYASEGDFRPVPRQLGTGFDLNVVDAVCYLLDIRLEERHRGQGHGSALYELLVQVAAALGCSEIRQTPSGTTMRGESRQDWLLRRGWKTCGRLGHEVSQHCGTKQ